MKVKTLRFDFDRTELVVLREAMIAYHAAMLKTRNGEQDDMTDCAATLKTDLAVALRNPDLE